MIRVRDDKGNPLELGNLQFVEICDADGNVHKAIFETKDSGLTELTKNSENSSKYENLFNVKFSDNVINIDLEKEQDGDQIHTGQ